MLKRQWLADKREDKTHEAVAIEAGIKRSYYTQIENGTRNPSVGTAKKIANALNFDWTLFFAEEGRVMQHSKGVV